MKSVVRPLMAAGLTTALLSTVAGGSAGAATGSALGPTGDARANVSAQAQTQRGDRIKCAIETHQAHYSHHAGQKSRHRVNVVADVTCDKPVPRISMAVGLYRNGKIYKRSGVRTNYNKAFLKQNASRRCVKKQKYAGYAKASVLFPPGYHPRTGKLADKGPERVIRKCKKGG
ncbi:hypothetical protein [Streptomyces sp. ODS28]|uniref:hypothetical protein n=1 Tax=Streptomyces sp. ODS28 TaxID=3136688 RepID=UPI0031E7D1F0